jgi:hypothetical protein
MVLSVTRILREGTRQLEIEYPFTEPQATLGHTAITETQPEANLHVNRHSPR